MTQLAKSTRDQLAAEDERQAKGSSLKMPWLTKEEVCDTILLSFLNQVVRASEGKCVVQGTAAARQTATAFCAWVPPLAFQLRFSHLSALLRIGG